mmetsp:Transcript_10455/g.32427  ORF Transcript_10455/g.32427 Transcript_10455/m.32427 type:complete len:263 (+) Transcript_10455:598-1386(+)
MRSLESYMVHSSDGIPSAPSSPPDAFHCRHRGYRDGPSSSVSAKSSGSARRSSCALSYSTPGGTRVGTFCGYLTLNSMFWTSWASRELMKALMRSRSSVRSIASSFGRADAPSYVYASRAVPSSVVASSDSRSRCCSSRNSLSDRSGSYSARVGDTVVRSCGSGSRARPDDLAALSVGAGLCDSAAEGRKPTGEYGLLALAPPRERAAEAAGDAFTFLAALSVARRKRGVRRSDVAPARECGLRIGLPGFMADASSCSDGSA